MYIHSNNNRILRRIAGRVGAPRNIATDILISARGMEVDQLLRDAVHRKVGRVRQYAPNALRARVSFERVNPGRSVAQFRTAVLYEVPGNDLVAQHTAPDPLSALDLVSEKIERRLRRRKTARLASRVRAVRKQQSRTQTGARAVRAGDSSQPQATADRAPARVR